MSIQRGEMVDRINAVPGLTVGDIRRMTSGMSDVMPVFITNIYDGYDRATEIIPCGLVENDRPDRVKSVDGDYLLIPGAVGAPAVVIR